jgi:hypothetical protein
MLVSFNSWFRVVSRLYALEFLLRSLRKLVRGPTGQVLVLVDGGLEAEGDEALDVAQPRGAASGFGGHALHLAHISAQLGVHKLGFEAGVLFLMVAQLLQGGDGGPETSVMFGPVESRHDASFPNRSAARSAFTASVPPRPRLIRP